MKTKLMNGFYSLVARLRGRIELWRKMRAERKNRAMTQDWDDVWEDAD